ncbi:molybdopterin molybdotransferase [Halogranum amylolyticum]|uniref:Molybdopterin molybdotransferase n=1 Tax=Halogranum amylolyticum TaxID=660520 RepID=A0A1H8NIN3_9EURY|nr:gephyrin-like molybdotransferase Glp [Halogranum amylolyticum]SEO29480.1 molybdopterin molybdotransferase [Halogranum amylolyticum]
MSHDDLRRAGFKDRTRVAAARETLLEAVTPHERTDRVPLERADDRTVAEPLTAPNPVPSYERAAMDGYAVRAQDTFGSSDRSPSVLREGDDEVVPGEAVRVHTGSELPDGADAVVMIEQTDAVGDELEVFDAVAEGENVGPVGEDVAEGETLYEPGHRLRPSDLGLLKSVGIREVAVYDYPTVGVVPTGEELVQSDPAPGEVIETNGLTVSKLVSRWGGVPTYRDVVTDDPEALRAAIQRDLTKDVVVLTGGSSVGARDYTPEVVDELGEVLVHGVALKPGHPVALGVVEETPVLMLPGYPVACIVNAVQFLRPVLKRMGRLPVEDQPTVEATLTRKVTSDPGTRTFVRVKVDRTDGDEDEDGDDGPERRATPTRASGSGVLSSVALADGWVVVPEEREGIAEGETVAVENWEWSA